MQWPGWYISLSCWSFLLLGTVLVIALFAWVLGRLVPFIYRTLEAEAVVMRALWRHVRNKPEREL